MSVTDERNTGLEIFRNDADRRRPRYFEIKCLSSIYPRQMPQAPAWDGTRDPTMTALSHGTAHNCIGRKKHIFFNILKLSVGEVERNKAVPHVNP